MVFISNNNNMDKSDYIIEILNVFDDEKNQVYELALEMFIKDMEKHKISDKKAYQRELETLNNGSISREKVRELLKENLFKKSISEIRELYQIVILFYAFKNNRIIKYQGNKNYSEIQEITQSPEDEDCNVESVSNF